MSFETNERSVNLKGDVKEVTKELYKHRGLTVQEYIRLKALEEAERKQLESILREIERETRA